tara:strand:+ start:2042 stop:2179 length:138 start_codon:yes stop_codon:yes gene_type:complete
MMHGVITVDKTDEMAALVAGLTERGICFDAEHRAGVWVITLTGGY